MSEWPHIKFNKFYPLQDYYQDREGNRYCVSRLVDEAKNLPILEIPLVALDLSDVIWKDENIYDLAFHVKRVQDADLEHPILLDWNGTIADGRHRIIKAIVEGRTTIKARRLTWKPSHCQTEAS